MSSFFEQVMVGLSEMMNHNVGMTLGQNEVSVDVTVGGSGNPQIVACEDVPFTVLGSAWLASACGTVFFACATTPKEWPRQWTYHERPTVRAVSRIASAAFRVLAIFCIYIIEILQTKWLRSLHVLYEDLGLL